MKPQNRKLLFTVTTGTLVLGIAGAGGFLVYNALKKKDVPFINYTFSSKDTLGEGLQIKMAPVNQSGDKDLFFLSNEGKTKFASAIKHDLNYGPEFYDVPNIYIDNENGISSDENGNYLPSGARSGSKNPILPDSINLSSKTFRDYGLPPVKLDAINDPNQDLKIELLMQVLFHEYGHFQANKYIQSEPRKSNQETLNVFMDTTTNETKDVPVIWNKHFIDAFQKDLNYVDKKDAHGNSIHQEPLLKGQSRTGKSEKEKDGTQSLGSLYSAEDIFQQANHVDRVNKIDDLFPELIAYNQNKLNVNYSYGGLATPIAIEKEKSYNYDDAQLKKNKKNLAYLYSADEVFTRKYQQILMPYHTAGNQNGIRLTWNGVVVDAKGHGKISPYQIDTLNYMDTPLGSKDNYVFPNEGYDGIDSSKDANVFMADNPFAAKQDLYDIYAEQVGYKDNGHSDDVSVIYYDKHNKIRIGGYLPNQLNNIKGNQSISIGTNRFKIKTEIHDARFRLMKSFKGKDPYPFEAGLSKKFWVSEPIDPNDFDNLLSSPLNFYKTDTVRSTTFRREASTTNLLSKYGKGIPMQYTKNGSVGVVTTWRSSAGHIHDNYYVTQGIDGIKIEKGWGGK